MHITWLALVVVSFTVLFGLSATDTHQVCGTRVGCVKLALLAFCQTPRRGRSGYDASHLSSLHCRTVAHPDSRSPHHLVHVVSDIDHHPRCLILADPVFSWYVAAQIFAPLALRQLAISQPYHFKIPIYTQWGMLGVLLIINVLLPESPWWLVQTGKIDKAEEVLEKTHKGVPGYETKHELVSPLHF